MGDYRAGVKSEKTFLVESEMKYNWTVQNVLYSTLQYHPDTSKKNTGQLSVF